MIASFRLQIFYKVIIFLCECTDDTSCPTIQQLNSENFFNSGVLSVLNWDASLAGQNMLLKLNSNVLFYTIIGNDSVDLTEFYTIKAGPQISRQVGTWNRSHGLLIPEPNIWERRSNLGGISMDTCVIGSTGFLMKVNLDPKEIQKQAFCIMA